MTKTFTIDDLRHKLQERQYKMTPQRKVVLQILLEHPGEHLSAEDVYGYLRKDDSEIGLATVYRSLELLAEIGILQKIEFGDGCSRYEVNNTDPNSHHHHHLICRKCGKVIEFEEDMLEQLEKDIEEKQGFIVEDHQVKFYGLCRECAAAEKAGKAASGK